LEDAVEWRNLIIKAAKKRRESADGIQKQHFTAEPKRNTIGAPKIQADQNPFSPLQNREERAGSAAGRHSQFKIQDLSPPKPGTQKIRLMNFNKSKLGDKVDIGDQDIYREYQSLISKFREYSKGKGGTWKTVEYSNAAKIEALNPLPIL